MSDSAGFDTTDLRGWLGRLRAGDRAARDDLLRAAQGRLDRMISRMLRRQPPVARWADTGDVFAAAALRLLRALQDAPVADTRGFFNLAARCIRLELIDLARKLYGPHGVGTNHASNPAGPPEPAWGVDPADLDRWAAFHEAVGRLPDHQREVFELTFYHGWKQREIAELLETGEKTVRRHLAAAAAALDAALGGDLPGR